MSAWQEEAREAMHRRHGCAKVLDQGTGAHYCARHFCGWLNDVNACAHVDAAVEALAPVVEAEVRRAWDEAAHLADGAIEAWSRVPGLHPAAPEPHPAALRAAGARRTLEVLRARMSRAFNDRAAAIEAGDPR